MGSLLRSPCGEREPERVPLAPSHECSSAPLWLPLGDRRELRPSPGEVRPPLPAPPPALLLPSHAPELVERDSCDAGAPEGEYERWPPETGETPDVS
jgi:hypothetical protein